MAFWQSAVGAYVVQSVLHGLVALVVTEVTIQAWQVHDALLRFRYRLSILLLAAGMMPLFQALDPSRGDFYFRVNVALFDSQRWLLLRSWDDLPVAAAVVTLVLLAAAAVTLLQEIAPALRRSREASPPAVGGAPDAVRVMLGELARRLGLPSPTLTLVDFPAPIIVTSGVRTPTILVSRELLARLDARELRAALAHELAHVVRRSNLTTLVVFVLRVLMLYNPVALLVFRRLVQDDEQICDEMTSRLTGDPEALATALSRLLEDEAAMSEPATSARDRIEEAGFRLLLKERIERLRRRPSRPQVGGRWEGMLVSVGAILVICYFIV